MIGKTNLMPDVNLIGRIVDKVGKAALEKIKGKSIELNDFFQQQK